jgi:hypothetical protein
MISSSVQHCICKYI